MHGNNAKCATHAHLLHPGPAILRTYVFKHHVHGCHRDSAATLQSRSRIGCGGASIHRWKLPVHSPHSSGSL